VVGRWPHGTVEPACRCSSAAAGPAERDESDHDADRGNHRSLAGEQPRAERPQQLGAQVVQFGVEAIPEGVEPSVDVAFESVEPSREPGLELVEVVPGGDLGPADRWDQVHHRRGSFLTHVLLEPGEQLVGHWSRFWT